MECSKKKEATDETDLSAIRARAVGTFTAGSAVRKGRKNQTSDGR